MASTRCRSASTAASARFRSTSSAAAASASARFRSASAEMRCRSACDAQPREFHTLIRYALVDIIWQPQKAHKPPSLHLGTLTDGSRARRTAMMSRPHSPAATRSSTHTTSAPMMCWPTASSASLLWPIASNASSTATGFSCLQRRQSTCTYALKQSRSAHCPTHDLENG